MEQNNQSNFNVITPVKSGKKSKTGLIVGAIIVLFLAVSIPAGVYLVKQQQSIKEKAQSALQCPAAEACPVAGEPALLKSCYSATTGDAPQEISCSTIANVKTTALCGGKTYCCPSLGAAWTTDVSLCASPVPTATATTSPTDLPTPTGTGLGTALPTSTATASATATATAASDSESTGSAIKTSVPIPVTGTNWPTVVGAGIGILVIIGSILLVI